MECSYCGKPDSPVRQVPAPVPCSDCYCDNPECVKKCREAYWAIYAEAYPERAKTNVIRTD